MATNGTPLRILHETIHRLLVVVGASALTLGVFLVLPLLASLSAPAGPDTTLQTVSTTDLPPPPPPPEPEPEKEDEPEEPPEPPELVEETPPLDLSQLELALNAGMGGGFATGDFALRLPTEGEEGKKSAESIFSLADLDQRPRVIHQPSPTVPPQLKAKAPANVYIIFTVDQRGRVENPAVQSSSDPAFEQPALAAVRQWRFEPGKRGGEPVRFRMRVPITFPKDR
jgi:periplasmic protein TonB